MTHIKEFIFDLGGVYFTKGTSLVLDRFYTVLGGPTDRVDDFFGVSNRKEGYQYRKGELTREVFWALVQEEFGIAPAVSEELREAWNNAYTPLPGVKDLVAKLREDYRVIAFSDNIEDRVQHLSKKYGLLDDFDDYLFSFDAHKSKEDMEMSKELLSRIQHKPEECVLIDDRESNIRHSEAIGIRALLFTSTGETSRRPAHAWGLFVGHWYTGAVTTKSSQSNKDFQIRFIPIYEEPPYIAAAAEYQEIWDTEGERIIKKFQELSGLTFIEDRIAAIVYEWVSFSGRAPQDVMKLRASYTKEIKLGTLIHELGHRLLFNLKEIPKGFTEHKALFLLLYDMYVALYGEAFAKDQVAFSSGLKGKDDYAGTWKWALGFDRQERADTLKGILHSS